MIEVIKTQPPQPDNAYCVLNDTLYDIAAPIKYDNANRLQLVVPSQLQPDALEQAHSGEFGGGHTGIDKTYDKLRKRYFILRHAQGLRAGTSDVMQNKDTHRTACALY